MESDEDYQPSDAGSARELEQGSGLSSEQYNQPEAGSTTFSSPAGSRKRHIPSADYTDAPLKRQRRTFNTSYLNLLNEDIANAAAGIIIDPSLSFSSLLLPSQIGTTRWSEVEKEAFFSALGRLGRDDLPGIAARIGTKGPLEVHQYITLLAEREGVFREDQEPRRRTLKPVDIPAAVEISQECCNALEEAADDLSLRQESYEVGVEEKRWGDSWLVTEELAESLEGTRETEQELAFADLFIPRNWLKLSRHIFMNSTIPEYNWRWVSDEPPAVRTTALTDFHALAVSVTKRLVATTLFMSESRIRSKREALRQMGSLVKARDVRAAVEALSLKFDAQEFWACAARRLRLDVYRDDEGEMASPLLPEDGDEQDDNTEGCDDHDAFMSYDEIEKELGYSKHNDNVDEVLLSEDDDDKNSDTESSIEGEDLPLEEELAIATEDEAEPDASLDQVSIQRDMHEAIYYSAEYEGTTRFRQTLRRRIENEHRMEVEAEDRDARVGVEQEAQLWAVLRQQPDSHTRLPEIGKGVDEGKDEVKNREMMKRSAYQPARSEWREGVQYVSEWENLCDLTER